MIGEYVSHVGALHTQVATLLVDDAGRHTFFGSSHGLQVHRLTHHDLHARLQQIESALPPFASHALAQSLTLPRTSASTVVSTSTASIPFLHPSAHLPLDASPSCPQLRERCDTYERLYLSAILNTLNKHDSKYLPGGEYTKPSLRSVHIQASTRSVERVFSNVDRQFKSRGPHLRAILISALIATNEAADTSTFFDTYHKPFKVATFSPLPSFLVS